MGRLSRLIPTDEDLSEGLSTALGLAGSGKTLLIIDRQKNDYASTHPSEIVVCEVSGSNRNLLVKYGERKVRGAHAGRGGVEYEADVYRYVLDPINVGSAPLMGVFDDERNECTWLILEYLPGCLRLDDSESAIGQAAAWLGKFHARAEQERSPDRWPFLKVYDAGYYTHWAEGAARRIAPLHDLYPWLREVSERFGEWVTSLSNTRPTVIHGEYYPHNILARDSEVFPIDWESAALGFGEIDLVSLVDGWDPETVKACKIEYTRTRWGGEAPADFDRSLDYADIYWNFRWLSGLGRNREPFNPQKMTQLPPRIRRLKAHFDHLTAE